IALAVAGWFFSRGRRAQALTERDSVVVADFVNTTGDSIFDGALKQALAFQLEQSPFLNIVPEQRVRETLRLMGRSPDARLTADVGREVCQRTGSKALLSGSIESIGSQYVLTLTAMNCLTGESLARQQQEADTKEHVLATVGKGASAIRTRLGESLASVRKFDTPIEQASTSSLEALKAFSLAQAQRAKGAEADAVPFFKRAIELDPNFTLAYGKLAWTYGNLNEDGPARQYASKAYELRGRVSDLERFYVDATYYGLVTGDVASLVESYKLWIATYPRDFTPRNTLGAYYISLGQNEKGFAELNEALQLNPNHVYPYANLALAYVHTDRLDEAQAVIEKARSRHLDSVELRLGLFLIAFLKRDAKAMQQQVESVTAPADQAWLFGFEGEAEAFHGHEKTARQRM